jgi:hypothetical protein
MPSLASRSVTAGSLASTLATAVRKARYRAAPREEFLADVRRAIDEGRGYAAAKIGFSEQHWLYYDILLDRERDPAKIASFEDDLRFHGLKQEGVFPAEPSFYRDWNRFYVPHLRNIDCLGVFYYPWELRIVRHHEIKSKLVYFADQQTDPYSESTETTCYLPYFRGKKILIVCPFAGILKERATKEIFEGVWSNAGKKKWFDPESVDALEFPYGFSAETQRTYGTAIRLFDDVAARVEGRDFDVALIAAGGLAIPLASHVKSMGKVALDLGGHLQLVFGVLGKRHRNRTRAAWNDNEWCIDMPARYRPPEADEVCDGGAYW